MVHKVLIQRIIVKQCYKKNYNTSNYIFTGEAAMPYLNILPI